MGTLFCPYLCIVWVRTCVFLSTYTRYIPHTRTYQLLHVQALCTSRSKERRVSSVFFCWQSWCRTTNIPPHPSSPPDRWLLRPLHTGCVSCWQWPDPLLQPGLPMQKPFLPLLLKGQRLPPLW